MSPAAASFINTSPPRILAAGVGARYFLPGFIRKLIVLATGPYRYRVGTLVIGPTNTVVRSAWKLVAHFIPSEFQENVWLSPEPRQVLEQLMPLDEIPEGIFEAQRS